MKIRLSTDFSPTARDAKNNQNAKKKPSAYVFLPVKLLRLSKIKLFLMTQIQNKQRFKTHTHKEKKRPQKLGFFFSLLQNIFTFVSFLDCI